MQNHFVVKIPDRDVQNHLVMLGGKLCAVGGLGMWRQACEKVRW